MLAVSRTKPNPGMFQTTNILNVNSKVRIKKKDLNLREVILSLLGLFLAVIILVTIVSRKVAD